MKMPISWLMLVLMLVFHGAAATVYRSVVYTATSLTEEHIHVDIRSDIPGNIRWIFTNETVLTVSVYMSADSRELLDETSVFYQSNSSTCVLHLNALKHHSEAAVTGTGSKSCHVLFLIWLSIIVVEWRHIHLLLLLLLANGVVQSMAMRNKPEKPLRSVDIEILAPRRFQYNDPHLVIDGGRVRLLNTEPDLSGIIKCATEAQDYTGCESCCHGNGYCFQNQCHCDPGFDPQFNCSRKLRDDTLYSHPLDPRLSRSVLPSGEVATMSYVSNSKEKLGRVKNPQLVYLDTRSDANRSAVYFYSDGMLKKINLSMQNQTYTLQIKRTRGVKCHMTIIVSSDQSKRYSHEVDICVNNNGLKSKDSDSISNKLKNKNSNTKTNDRTDDRSRVYRQRTVVSADTVGIPVTAMRCSGENALDYNVMFEMLTQTKNSNTHHGQETVYLSTKLDTKSYRTQRYLQLPRTISIGSNALKCKAIKYNKSKICNKQLLLTYKRICDINDIQSVPNATKTVLSIFQRHCYYVLNVLTYFCDNRQMTNDHTGEECGPLYSHSVDLFSSLNYFVRPIVTFTDGKNIIGSWREVTMQSIMGLSKTGIVIQDDKPEVKIVKVTVIPTDPVPQDIYQVRLEYACATNQTVIRMNVTGSDLYKNHVTCTGITDCSCCILHAAGATDAVVDHVTINITDSISGVSKVKQMVVIF